MSRLLPLLLFAGLAVLLWVGLGIADRKNEIPSPLIDKPLPAFELPRLDQPQVLVSQESLLGSPYLLNVWASWCPPCRLEHPLIIDLVESGTVPVLGLNYKDEPDNARAWLEGLGDPYFMVLTDYDGRAAIDLGVYGAPESFLVDGQGMIRYKHIGPLTREVIEQELKPALAAIQADNNKDTTP